MQRVVRHIVLSEVRKAVLKGPHRERVKLLALPHWQSGALGTFENKDKKDEKKKKDEKG